MLKRVFLLIAGALIFAGCGAKARVDIYMEPIKGGDEYALDRQTGVITLEKEDVRITVKALNAADLLAVTKDPDINPYIDVSFWGNVKPLFTIFDVNVKNKRGSRVIVDSVALLIDKDGEQYASLPYDFFKSIFSAQDSVEVVHSYPYYRQWYYPSYRYPYYYYPRSYPHHVRRYSDDEVRHQRMVARETLFDGGKLYKGARRGGLLVFEKLDESATEMRLIIPEVIIYDGKKKRKVNFEFDFRQKVAVNEK